QLVDVVSAENFFPRQILLALPRQSMSEPIQLDCQSRERAIKIKEITRHRMLSAELKAGESTGAQRPPKLFLYWSLFSSQPPCIPGRIHMTTVKSNRMKSMCILSPAYDPNLSRDLNAAGIARLTRSLA